MAAYRENPAAAAAACLLALTAPLATAKTADSSYLDALAAANPPVDGIACAFTVTTEYGADRRVERIDQDGVSQLLSIDGAAADGEATQDEQPGWMESAPPAPTDEAEHASIEPIVFAMQDFDPPTPRRMETTEDESTITFVRIGPLSMSGEENLQEASDDDVFEAETTLIVDKATMRPLRSTIVNRQTFSPAFSVKIKELRQEFTWRYMPEIGASAAVEMRMRMRGKALLFKKLDETMLIRFEDFDCGPRE